MSVSIIACPSCKTLLLSDTIQCPSCQHVFDHQRVESLAVGPLPSEQSEDSLEDPCPNCGETVRRGLVRCWNCSSFMRKEIADSYRKMQESPSPVIYSQVPKPKGAQGKRAAKKDVPQPRMRPPMDEDPSVDDLMAADEDFELAPGVTPLERDEDDFDLNAEVVKDVAFAANKAAADRNAAASPVAGRPPAPVVGRSPDRPASSTEGLPGSPGDLRSQESAGSGDPRTTPGGVRSEESAGSGDNPRNAGADEPGEAHSVATAGDVLLQVALSEQAETEKRRTGRGKRGRRTSGPGGLLVYCPNGHRIEVPDRHRGKLARCPKCKEMYRVPEKTWEERLAEQRATGEGEAAAAAAADPGRHGPDQAGAPRFGWMNDVHIHTFEPEKLKLKPGSLQAAFEPMDLGFLPDGLLAVTLVKKGGLFGAADKKKEPAREAVRAHVAEGKPLDEMPAASKQLFKAETVDDIRVVQPVVYDHESMFAGVPVFGVGRIAVRLPKADEKAPIQFASFGLSEFREFAAHLGRFYSLRGLGEDCGIPLTDEFTELTCHYSEEKLQVLEKLEFYQADPKFKLKLIGRRCQGCQLVVSEDSRKKENIGGKTGKGIAKAKCPKCGAKFGDISLFTLDAEPAPTTGPEAAETPTPSPEAPATTAPATAAQESPAASAAKEG